MMQVEAQEHILRAAAEARKRCAEEVAAARAEERREAAREQASVQRAQQERDDAAARGLLELERLHEARVRRLEQALAAARRRAGAAEGGREAAAHREAVEAADAATALGETRRRLEATTDEAHTLAADLQVRFLPRPAPPLLP